MNEWKENQPDGAAANFPLYQYILITLQQKCPINGSVINYTHPWRRQ